MKNMQLSQAQYATEMIPSVFGSKDILHYTLNAYQKILSGRDAKNLMNFST